MPILNYTTTISPDRSVAEISKILVAHGATRITTHYSPDRTPVGIAFCVETLFGERPFLLHAKIDGVEAALARQRRTGKVERRMVCREHAARVGWRILKDWIEVQMAVIDAGHYTVEEIMLPFMILKGDQTVYQAMVEQRLALPGPGPTGR